MPYIKPEWRQAVDPSINVFRWYLRKHGLNDNDGVLNYVITKLILDTMVTTVNYDTIQRVRGLLTGIRHEFDRRVADPYEDQKIAENGDVYEN